MEKWCLWSHENAILHLDGSQVQELERKRTAAQTKAVVSSAAESGCLDISVEMSASDSSPVWLLAQFTGVKDPSEVRSLTLRGVDRLVPVSIPFWICCDLVWCVRLPRYFWNGFSFSHSWEVDYPHCQCGWYADLDTAAVQSETGLVRARAEPNLEHLN